MDVQKDISELLLGTWQTSDGITIILEKFSPHLFSGRIQLVDSNSVPIFERKICGVAYTNLLTKTILSFFFDIQSPFQYQHSHAFTCEFVHSELLNMKMYWIEYDSNNIKKLISSGNATLEYLNKKIEIKSQKKLIQIITSIN